jgi:two-component sensor histidine kinase
VESSRSADSERRWELDLPAEATSPRLARELVRSATETWGRPELGPAAGLCATELVTNVLEHTHCPGCRLVVSYQNDRLYIEVHDDSPDLPERSVEPVEAEHGRGLRIVDAVALEWGIETEPRSGKSVWVLLSVDPEENS